MTDLIYAPPPFKNTQGDLVVFVDFTHARYQLDFDAEAQKATACSQITFQAQTPGLAAISMNQPIMSAQLDKDDVELVDEDSPTGNAKFKVLSKPVARGIHVLTIKSELTEPGPHTFLSPNSPHDPITWLCKPARLHCSFEMTDRRADGGFLEAYLPSNYEYDHFRMSLSVTVKNSPDTDYSIFSNGAVSNSSQGHWDIEFPAFFTTSCPWFHLGPTSDYNSREDTFSSCDGRTVPILVYTKSQWEKPSPRLEDFVQSSKVVLHELECDFGPFPHGALTVFAVPSEKGKSGGMEYAGATVTRLKALRHELIHSYFGRSVLPVNGDAGWVDEAIAKWVEAGYSPRLEEPPDPGANMGGRSEYARTTCTKAYTIGKDFLAHLDHLLRDRGGLKPFLKQLAKQKRHQSITAVEFQELVEDYYGASLQQLFEACVYSEASNPEETT